MNRLNWKWLGLVLLAMPLLAQTSGFVGDWQGVLKVSGIELRLVFHITQTEDRVLTATMDSPDQGANGIPVSTVLVHGDSISLEVAVARGIYRGVMDREAEAIHGVWEQGGQRFPLPLKPLTDADVIKRPQMPKPPYPYAVEEVSYPNPVSGFQLAGTLTLPEGADPFPVVLLITGSGAQDRDETLLAHKPFWVIADHLTRRGIAVLRVDDRGVGGSTGSFATATTADFATDVEAGLSYLQSRPEIDKSKIGLMGHSEGGMIAPMVAARSEDVAFIVLLAGTGLTGEEILYMQSELILIAGGGSEEDVQDNRSVQEAMFRVIREQPNRDSSAVELHRVMKSVVNAMPEEARQALGDIDAYIHGQIQQVNSPWFRYFIQYNPIPALEGVRCPVLALFGEKDLQVPPEENLAAMEQAFKHSGHADFTLKILPSLNHLFQHAQTGAPSEYGKIEETFSEDALELITRWIASRF